MVFVKKTYRYIGIIGAILTAIGFFLPFFDERIWEGAPFILTNSFLPLQDGSAFGAICAVLLNLACMVAAALLFAKGKAAAKTLSGGFVLYFLLMTYITVKYPLFVRLRFGFWFMAIGCAMMLLAPGRAETTT